MSNLARELDSLIEDFLGRVERVRDDAAAEDAALVAGRDALALDRERLNAEVGDLREKLKTAERWRDRFRYALWVYLQERDGVLGIHAPSLDTLKKIRELLEEPLTD